MRDRQELLLRCLDALLATCAVDGWMHWKHPLSFDLQTVDQVLWYGGLAGGLAFLAGCSSLVWLRQWHLLGSRRNRLAPGHRLLWQNGTGAPSERPVALRVWRRLSVGYVLLVLLAMPVSEAWSPLLWLVVVESLLLVFLLLGASQALELDSDGRVVARRTRVGNFSWTERLDHDPLICLCRVYQEQTFLSAHWLKFATESGRTGNLFFNSFSLSPAAADQARGARFLRLDWGRELGLHSFELTDTQFRTLDLSELVGRVQEYDWRATGTAAAVDYLPPCA